MFSWKALALWFIGVVTLGSNCASQDEKHGGRSGKNLVFPDDVKTRQFWPKDGVQMAPAPPTIKVQLKPQPRVKGNRIEIEAVLSNSAPDAYLLMVSPGGGDPPYGGQTPLSLRFAPSSNDKVKYVGELFPPEPPLPMEIRVPGNSEVRFRAHLDLSMWEWKGSPDVEVSWTFSWYLDAPSPTGLLQVRLPRR